MQTTCAVVGVGHVGRYHAEKYAALPNAELVALADPDLGAATRVAARCGGCPVTADYRELLGRVEAVSIAVPTRLHYAVARDFIAAGVHVLLEKPIAASPEQAGLLDAMAREHGVILQVGHLERFDPAVLELCGRGIRPLFIESHRLAPFPDRGADVDVVRDLMIHDLDIILQLARAPIERVSACGARVLSDEVDIANARIAFADGCVANVTASRVSTKTERIMRVFLHDAYFAIDFCARSLRCHRVADAGAAVPGIVGDSRSFDATDAIRAEIIAFLEAIQSGGEIVVSGEDGVRALELAARIEAQVRRSATVLGNGPGREAQ